MSDLRALAEAATPGPWEQQPSAAASWVTVGEATAFRAASPADAAFIAAANPTVVLALLDVVDAAIGLRDHTHLMHDTEYDTDALWQALYRYSASGMGNAGWCVHGIPYGPTWRCGMCVPGQDTNVTLLPERPRRRHITGRITPVDRAGKQYDVDLWVEDVP